jgi:(1->4)-alpha-D-glucan 1-alpha-D-glucosylmutase
VTEADDLIEPYYYDYWGKRVEPSESTRRALRTAILRTCDAESLAVRSVPNGFPGDAIVVCGGQRPAVAAGNDRWWVQLEDDSEFESDLAELPLGYHTLRSRDDDSSIPLIVCPSRCHLPAAMRRKRIWAVSTQLYALRSPRNWGIGDFSDLREFARLARRVGAGAVALNPLHALHPHNPSSASPYSPSSRLFLNALYIDVERVVEFYESADVRSLTSSNDFVSRLENLRSKEFVDYLGVAAAKLRILEQLYDVFRREHLHRNDARARSLKRFCSQRGARLERLATYEALAAHFSSRDPTCYGWQQWPAEYRSPESPVVARFSRDHRRQIDFFLYVQWIAESQLKEAAADARRARVSLYLDLAVGNDVNGADVWADQEAFVVDASLGAPADALNLDGQNWGLAPLSPLALRKRAYRPFIELLRANMRHAGILRVDHVMALRRAFWIPHGARASSGAYVRYPLNEMLGILALESVRNKCAVVGEDLGTVPEGFRERLESVGALSTRLFYFTRDWSDGSFLSPQAYPRLSAVSIGTHDLPPLAGWWTGDRAAAEDRAGDRLRFVDALERAGAIDATGARRLREDAARGGTLAVIDQLSAAAYCFLGATPSMLVVIAIEDALGETGAVNVPGTFDEHPNWRRKRVLSLEKIESDVRLMQIGKVMSGR